MQRIRIAKIMNVKFHKVFFRKSGGSDRFGRYLPSVPYDNLGSVLIGHNNSRLGEPITEGVWIVRTERLLDHTDVMM